MKPSLLLVALLLPTTFSNGLLPHNPNSVVGWLVWPFQVFFTIVFGVFSWLAGHLAAFLFGSAHAFTPGHGKTLVAAYLVGERGTVGHAVILAVATTVAHTGSVIAVAAVLWTVYGNNVPGSTQGVLQFAGGFLVGDEVKISLSIQALAQ